VVLRTGFDSSQGNMVRMIEFSSEKVSGNGWEAALLVAFLLCFALTASMYVLRKGLAEDRDPFDLLLHCILIVTSVIPPELNMQLALAVNSSLLALMKAHVFCTEPFRIPLAGKVDICFFDKTGTITSDELRASSFINADSAAPVSVPMAQASLSACLVVAGCHSLVKIDNETVGDPLETAALRAVRWEFDASTATSRPRDPAPTAADATPSGGATPSPPFVASYVPDKPTVTILHRFHFSSSLQRMSVVARIQSLKGSSIRLLTKGSPEVIAALVPPGRLPSWYAQEHHRLTQQGMRIIALASRELPERPNSRPLTELSRTSAEQDLTFHGFISFRCEVRKDSRDVLAELLESSHRVAMITGDAILTAIHVATEVGICQLDKTKILILSSDELENASGADILATNHECPKADTTAGIPTSAGYDACRLLLS